MLTKAVMLFVFVPREKITLGSRNANGDEVF